MPILNKAEEIYSIDPKENYEEEIVECMMLESTGKIAHLLIKYDAQAQNGYGEAFTYRALNFGETRYINGSNHTSWITNNLFSFTFRAFKASLRFFKYDTDDHLESLHHYFSANTSNDKQSLKACIIQAFMMCSRLTQQDKTTFKNKFENNQIDLDKVIKELCERLKVKIKSAPPPTKVAMIKNNVGPQVEEKRNDIFKL